LEPQKS